MNQLAALVWKEWRESQTFLWIALGMFVGLPCVAGFEAYWQYSKHFDLASTPWVGMFGGILAIFVAVGATCRDFNPQIQNFWQSRPVSVTRWFVVKYFLGLAIVWVSCTVPIVLDSVVSTRPDFSFKGAMLLSLFLILVCAVPYGFGFLTGCLLRRLSHAAILALSALLLVYFLPLLFPPLGWLKFDNLTSDFEADVYEFLLGTALIAIGAFELSLIVVKRDWRIESGRKVLYWSVALLFLVSISSVAYQLGTNMPVLAHVRLPTGENVRMLECDGNEGFFITERYINSNPYSAGYPQVDAEFRTLKVAGSEIEIGNPHRVDPVDYWQTDLATAPTKTTVKYFADELFRENGQRTCDLTVRDFASLNGESSLRLWNYQAVHFDPQFNNAPTITYVLNNHLYVFGTRLATLDISDPLHPKIISVADPPGSVGIVSYFFEMPIGIGADKVQVLLPPIPGLSTRQRLQAATHRYSWFGCADGDDLCQNSEYKLYSYRLIKLTDDRAVYRKTGEYESSILNAVFGSSSHGGMWIKNGLLYMGQYRGWTGGVAQGMGGSRLNPEISVFDLRGPKGLQLVGHFAAPGADVPCPLADGNLLVGGDQLWLAGPPPNRR